MFLLTLSTKLYQKIHNLHKKGKETEKNQNQPSILLSLPKNLLKIKIVTQKNQFTKN